MCYFLLLPPPFTHTADVLFQSLGIRIPDVGLTGGQKLFTRFLMRSVIEKFIRAEREWNNIRGNYGTIHSESKLQRAIYAK